MESLQQWAAIESLQSGGKKNNCQPNTQQHTVNQVKASPLLRIQIDKWCLAIHLRAPTLICYIWFTINTFSLNFSPQITNVAQQGEIERVKDVLLQVASTFFFNLRNNPTTFFSVKRHPRVIWERTNQQE